MPAPDGTVGGRSHVSHPLPVTIARARLAALAATLLVPGCQSRGPAMSGFPPPEVAVVEMTPRDVPELFDFPGQVEAFKRVEVRARVDGVIEERPFTEGTIVHPGEVLYRLDKIKYDAALRSAQAKLVNAKATLDRVTPLAAQNLSSPADLDNARADYASAQAAFDQAKKDLDDTDVKAQIEGRVGRTLLEVGARVTGPSDLLTTIDQLEPIYVTFEPSSQQLLEWRENPDWRGLIQPGGTLQVQVVLPDGTLLPRTGRLNFVSPSLDAATGTQTFRALFTNADRLLMPGQFVRVRLRGFTRHEAFAVPQRAVQTGLGRQFVYVAGKGDTVQVRDVETGPWSGDDWIIDRGLEKGDRVIVDGIQKTAPGRPVKPVPLADSSEARTAGAAQ